MADLFQTPAPCRRELRLIADLVLEPVYFFRELTFLRFVFRLGFRLFNFNLDLCGFEFGYRRVRLVDYLMSNCIKGLLQFSAHGI